MLPPGNPPIEPQQTPDFVINNETQEWLINLWDKCEKLQESEWLDIKRQMIRARNYFDGRFFGYVNNQLQWVDYPKKAGEITYSAPTYHAHIQTALTEISKGSVELSFSHVSGESRWGSLVAKIAETRYKAHRRRAFSATKRHQERLSLLLSSIAIRYTYVKDSAQEKRPMFSPMISPGQSVMACALCKSPSTGECPNCGSTELTPIEAPEMAMNGISGYEDYSCKESDWISLDPLGCMFYLNATCARETPFFIWKQSLLKEVVQAKYPDITIKEGVTSPELRYKAHSDTSVPGTELYVSGDDTGRCEINQGWFDVELYGEYKTTAELKLRNGPTIPAGVKLKQIFPKGIFICRNGKKILDLHGEDKNDKITIAPYVTRLGTLLGGGTSIALDNQDMKNDLRNLHMQSIFHDAFRKEFVDPAYIDPDQIPSDPTERGVLHNSPQGGNIIGGAIGVLPPSPLSPDAYAIEERFDGEMQMNLGTFSGTGSGMPDIKAVQDTAQGMTLWREMTVGRFYPMLEIVADALDREQAYQLLENDQKYLTPKQWEKYKGDFGAEALQAFLKCNLREELIIEVVPESFMPVSRSQKQAGLMGFSQFLANSQTNPESEIGAHAAELFGIPQRIVSNDAHYSAANVAIDAFKEHANAVIQQFGDVPNYDLNDPTTFSLAQLIISQANMPIAEEMDNLSVLADATRDWWATDEGRSASNLLKATIRLRMKEIDGAAITKMQEDQQNAMLAQQPQVDAQNAQMQAQAQAQQAQAQQAEEADEAKRGEEMQGKAIGKLMDTEQEDKRRAEDFAENERQRQHEREMQRERMPAAA